MAKKAKKKTVLAVKSRISPAVSANLAFVDYGLLKNGDAFLYGGQLWMKTDAGDQEAINLDTGKMDDYFCDRNVEQVNVAITWKKK